MLGLGIQKFWNMRPKLPFRFKVQFYTKIEEIYNIDEILAISLTNINLPKMEGQAGEGSLYLGDTVYTIPVWSLGSRKLEITFEETDNMAITRFIDEIHNKSWRKNPYRITIIVHQFDEKMREDNSKPTRYSQSTGYVCHLCSFQEPAFKRDGNAGQLTVTATFIIDSVIENWDVNEEGKYLVAGNTDSNKLDGYNDEIDFKDNSLKTRVDTSNLDNNEENSKKRLEEFKGDNVKREENYQKLLSELKAAGVDRSDTAAVVNYLQKNGYITAGYNKELNGLCATSTYVVAAITSGQEKLGNTAGHGESQDLSNYGYKKVDSGKGAAELKKLLAEGKLREGDVINISYADGGKYGHAVTVVKNKQTNKLEFVSDFRQQSIHGQSDENRVGDWYIQRRT
jgi:hypothetical protein